MTAELMVVLVTSDGRRGKIDVKNLILLGGLTDEPLQQGVIVLLVRREQRRHSLPELWREWESSVWTGTHTEEGGNGCSIFQGGVGCIRIGTPG